MGCTPSTQLHEDDYSVGDSSSDEDTAVVDERSLGTIAHDPYR